MEREQLARTSILHFTHVSHLPTIRQRGLLSDSEAQRIGCITQEGGHHDIKRRRRFRKVTAGQGGVVADYVPFYFAPRSPMMYSLSKGNVDTYVGSVHDLVYLRTTVEALVEHGLRPVFTDRNAVLQFCRFTCDVAEAKGMIDWPLMLADRWNNTEVDHDRKERRMAECLVHGRVPWSVFSEVAVYSPEVERRIATDATLAREIPVAVRPNWYF